MTPTVFQAAVDSAARRQRLTREFEEARARMRTVSEHMDSVFGKGVGSVFPRDLKTQFASTRFLEMQSAISETMRAFRESPGALALRQAIEDQKTQALSLSRFTMPDLDDALMHRPVRMPILRPRKTHCCNCTCDVPVAPPVKKFEGFREKRSRE